MKFEWVSATMRFDNISFSNEVIDGRSLPPDSTYACPRCDQHVGFRREQLQGASSGNSSFQADVAARFDEEAEARGHAGRGFLDWQCPGCRLLVRAYIDVWAGGRHGDAGANILEVVEGHDSERME